jgi:UDP-N-acetyl-D-mannosaminuronic acid dehydrogenase
MSKTCVMIGLGYIGLPTAVVLAKHGVKVHGVDINEKNVARIKEGRCTIVEPGLPEMLEEVVAAKKLTAGTKPIKGDVFVIAVPTPFEGGFKPDLSYVESATRSIAPFVEKGNLVIVESTVPVGATEQVARWLAAARPDLTFSRRTGNGEVERGDVLVAHCPERILPGNMLTELVENDRVIGGVCPASGEAGRAFYKTFVKGECLVTDARTAELAKLTENAFRDVNIAFANELNTICTELDINVWRLIELANHHPRVNILQPGPGVGGHCIAVDPWFIVSAFGEKARLIREARWINSGRPRQVVQEVLQKVKQGGAKSVACFGLAYKPDIDDLRESPAVEVVEHLATEIHFHYPDVTLMAVEPHVDKLPPELEGKPVSLVDVETALGADLIVMLVNHAPFRAIPAGRITGKLLVDTRGVWTRAAP